MVVDILTKGLSIPNIIYVHIVVIVGIEQYKNITFFFPSLPLAQSIIFSKKGIKPIHTLDLWYECVELGEKCVFLFPYSFILLMAMSNKKDLGLGKMAYLNMRSSHLASCFTL
jgi:hypothetical protein